jgi:hypothetical protein
MASEFPGQILVEPDMDTVRFCGITNSTSTSSVFEHPLFTSVTVSVYVVVVFGLAVGLAMDALLSPFVGLQE